MRSLFSIHAGEYLVGSYIERHYPELAVWLPSKDVGVDMLVTDRQERRTLSLQVKFSKDYLATHMPPSFRTSLRACGWWTFNTRKLAASTADYWVLVLQGFNAQSTDFVVIRPTELLRVLGGIHGKNGDTVQSYVWVSATGSCWEARGLRRKDQVAVVNGTYRNTERQLTAELNNWRPVEELLRPR